MSAAGDSAAHRAMRLLTQLRDSMPNDAKLALAEAVAASEIACRDLEHQDAQSLRYAALAYALDALGITSVLVDTIKQRLLGSEERPQSLRRH